MQQAAQKVKEAEENYQWLLSLRTDYDDMLRLEGEFPALDKKIGNFIAKVTTLEKTESEESAKLIQVTQDEKEANELLQETEEMVINHIRIHVFNVINFVTDPTPG